MSELKELPNLCRVESFEVMSKNTYTLHYERTTRSHPLAATILAFRLLGRMPLTRTKSGEFYFSTYSWWTLYCLVSIAIQLGMLVHVFKVHFVHKGKWSSFDTAVDSLMNICLLTTVSHPFLFTWKKSRSIVEALNRWKYLQDSFQVVTTSPVSSILLDHPYCGVVLVTCYLLFIEFIPIALHYAFSGGPDKLSIPTVTVYFVTTWYVKLVLWLWLMFTHSISQAARILKRSLTETMAREPSVRRLRLHRNLWWELHTYTREMTAAVGNTVRAYMVINVIAFYLSVYATAMSFVNDTVKANTIIPLMARGLQAFLINNASFLAEYQLGHDFIVKILSFNYHHFAEDQLEEVELFLYAIENSSGRFSLEHMVEPSRQTFVDILELALTIMVVFLQFRLSA